ncbi:DUF6352 family protein [Prosthecomicrobium sp. N25]|uniref:DUF6352 family protein n=1 Tax=Prosthecomicrobium sp. N25 TaxID=3129254 RepID=UPI0030769940
MHAHDFWISSGHHLLDRTEGGGLAVTDEFLKAYLARPEVVPPPEACDAERLLWARLKIAPRDPVAPEDIAAMADADARENWRFLVGFRDRLVAAPTLEAAYRRIVEGGAAGIPPLFLNQLVHAILRNALDDEADPFVLRAAEMFFRPQRLTLHEGTLLLADEELVDGDDVLDHNSPLVAMFGEARAKELDVMTVENAHGWYDRSDAFDMVQDFRHGGPARAGLARAVERWVRHLLDLEVAVEPVERVEDPSWVWFVGLDAEATRIGNALWTGAAIPEEDRNRVVALFRMEILDRARVRPDLAGRPVWLILAADRNRIVRMKPQNLVTGLPLAAATVA